MADKPDELSSGGAPRRGLWRKPSSRWLLGIPIGGLLMLLLGVVLANGFAYGLHATSTPSFCAESCHYMRDFVATELAGSVHGSNRSGVRATCPDCHIPQEVVPLIKRKIAAVREGWGHLTGVIDTRDKFEAHRPVMAERVWAYMKSSNSRECRTCHSFSAMNAEQQGRMAQRKHQAAEAKGETCIDCHKGVAHTMPPEKAEEAAEATPAAAASLPDSPASGG